MTTSLVTGGSGYFGALMVRELLERGDRVRILDIIDDAERDPQVEFVQGDIRDAGAVARAVKGVDRIFNNVAQVPLAKDPSLLRTVNVDGTVNLLRSAAEAGVAKVVHTSSSAVFGVPEHNPVTPDTVPKPQEAYGDAKLAAEWACLRAVSEGLDVSIVRPRTILGHGRLGIFGILFDWIADGADPIVLGDGSNRYQFVHAYDLATASIAAAERAGAGVYNIGAADVQTMATTVGNLCRYAQTGAMVRSLPVKLAGPAMQLTAKAGLTPFAPYHWLMYSRSMWFDIEPARVELGWEPTFSTDQMFAESYDWFCAHRFQATAGPAGSRNIEPVTSHHRATARQGILSIAKRITKFFPQVTP